MSSTSVDFPLPETPVTQVSAPSGKETVMFFRLFSAASTTVSQPDISISTAARLSILPGCDALPRNRDAGTTGKIISRQRILRAQDLIERALRDDLAAARARPRAKIDNVIRRSESFLHRVRPR